MGQEFKGQIPMFKTMSQAVGLMIVVALVSGCNGNRRATVNKIFKKNDSAQQTAPNNNAIPQNNKEKSQSSSVTDGTGTPITITDLFKGVDDNADIRVNKYLWQASIDTLSFLPIEAADPFSGVLVLGWGTAPGSSTQFRATVLIQDPALEAGSLKVALQKRGGPAGAETNRRVEDAILTRARQLRVRGAKRRIFSGYKIRPKQS